MANKIYTKLNFHSHTFCIWKEVSATEIQELKLHFKSKHDSQYYFTTDGVYRLSDHWGRVANCHWRLIPLTHFKNQNNTVAYANWCDFYSNDDSAKLFFIRVNEITLEVNFFHKHTAETENVVFRNAKETTKTIRTIKEVLTETDWAKHLIYSDLEILRKEVVNELVNSTKTFLEIKKLYLS